MLKRQQAGARWRDATAVHANEHQRAELEPRAYQERLLLDRLRRDANTAYGRAHDFASIHSVAAFQERVPVVDYQDLEPYMQRLFDGESGVLTTEPVLAFERSSGSAAAAKYIPYTASLLREFRRAIGAWMHNLLTHRPGLCGGAHYWSISPLARRQEVTPGGLPVGFAHDAGYLDPADQECLAQLLAVPSSVATAEDFESCRQLTLDHLTQCRDLRFISVWSPSFLLLMLDRLPPGVAPLDLWPELELVSCWTSASSQRFLPELARRLPGVEIQGKGLLATEGIVSFPILGRPAPAPAVTGHFLEFLDDDAKPHLVDELETGGRYRVVLTTGGGLTRYDLGDLVEVIADGALEFVGKSGTVSDLCGEKLSIERTDRVIPEACARYRQPGFAMLTPEIGTPPHYVLILDRAPHPELVHAVESALREAHDYDYCRRLGQLGPLRAVVIPNAEERFLHGCLDLGQRAGDVKSTSLRRETGWMARMESTA